VFTRLHPHAVELITSLCQKIMHPQKAKQLLLAGQLLLLLLLCHASAPCRITAAASAGVCEATRELGDVAAAPADEAAATAGSAEAVTIEAGSTAAQQTIQLAGMKRQQLHSSSSLAGAAGSSTQRFPSNNTATRVTGKQ
jgi:hypothetical protein